MTSRRLLLVCTDRGAHRPMEVYPYEGTWPPTEPALFHRGPVQELACPYARCARAPRPSRAQLVKLLTVAAALPDGRLDLSMLDM